MHSKKLNKAIELLEHKLGVATPSGVVMTADSIIRECKVHIGDRELEADLAILAMQDYDIILGMDGLTRHYATIDCRKKIVRFQVPEAEPFLFHGDKKSSRIPVI